MVQTWVVFLDELLQVLYVVEFLCRQMRALLFALISLTCKALRSRIGVEKYGANVGMHRTCKLLRILSVPCCLIPAFRAVGDRHSGAGVGPPWSGPVSPNSHHHGCTVRSLFFCWIDPGGVPQRRAVAGRATCHRIVCVSVQSAIGARHEHMA